MQLLDIIIKLASLIVTLAGESDASSIVLFVGSLLKRL